MKSFHAYARPDTAELRDVQRTALEQFASAIGAPQTPTNVGHWRAQVRRWEDEPQRPTALEDRPYGAAMLRALVDGDTLIAPSLSALFDLPSNAAAALRALISRGIAVYFLDLPGQTGATIQPVVSALADASHSLEHARKQLQGELAQVQGQAEARLDAALQEGLAQMARNWGLPSALKIGLPTIGDVTAPTNGHGGGHLGEAIAARRKGLGMTQGQLAKQLGINQSSVSRIETDGAGDHLPAALDFLFAPDTQGAPHEATA